MGLPSPSQVWSHATNSQAKLSQALRDPTLTAIEADILIGKLLPDTERNAEEDSGVRDSDGYCPIMAHPPDRQSNLSLRNFLEQVTHSEIRIIKLDFKEIDAVQPSLDILKSILSQRKSEITVILNADILAGPGARNLPVNVAPGAFFEICNDFLSSVGESQGAVASSFGLSLGFHVAPSESDHYTVDDSDAMHSLVCTSNVGEKAGIALALNARLLARNPCAFKTFLERVAKSQILAWTGAGEPPIERQVVEVILEHHRKVGMEDRIGFDCVFID